MIHYDYYSDFTPEEVDAFIRERELCRLVTVSAESLPHIGLYPFVYAGEAVELHLNRADEQIADLRVNPRCIVEVDEVLAVVPSYWSHPENAVMATAYHRTVALECEASVSDDGAALAEQQLRMLARYQPEGGFRTVTSDDPMYRGMIAMLCAVHLTVRARRVKFKIAQNRPPQLRAKIAEALRERGRPGDAHAADVLQWTIDREISR